MEQVRATRTMAKTLKSWLKSEPTFIGCFTKSHLPDFPFSHTSMIVNTEEDHWVGIVLTRHECFYFDSLANSIEEEIILFLQKRYRKIVYNCRPIQASSSTACGLFSSLFIKSVCSIDSYKRYMDNFYCCQKKKNDDIALKLYILPQ